MSKDLVILRGEAVELDSDVGRMFITDLCREQEELISADEIKQKWQLGDDQVLAANEPLIKAVRAELERRVYSGAAARDAAAVEFAKMPKRLGHMIRDPLEASRVKVDCIKELRAVASSGTPGEAGRERIIFTIITSGEPNARPPFVVEVQPRPEEDASLLPPITLPAPPEEEPLAPIVIPLHALPANDEAPELP